MSKYHVAAVFEQFPWLDHYCGNLRGRLENATVERADLRTLEMTAGFSPIGQWSHSRTRIYLFDRNGVLIHMVWDGMRWYHRLIRYFRLDGYYFGSSSSRTLRHAFAHIGNGRVQDCAYLVEVSIGSGPYGSYLTIIREPKDRTFADLLKEAVALETECLRNAHEEIVELAS